jgi:hypothetical protein
MKKAHHTQTEHLVHGLATVEEQQIQQHQLESSVDPKQQVHES